MIFDTKEIVIGGTEWKTAPFRFNKMFTLAGGSGGSYIDVLLSGVSPLALTNALGLNYIKALGATEQRNLPSGYTQVEYLESDGSQYINLGYQIDGTMSFHLKSRCLKEGFVFGSRATYDTKVSSLNYDSANDFFGIRMGNTIVYNSTKWTVNTDYEFYISDGDTKINGTTVSTTAYGTSFYSGNAYLFTINYNGVPGSSSLSINRIYYFQMFKNGVLTQNLIPCRRNSDSVLGMYDTVTGNFLTNSGTGTFTAGADIVPTPDTPMDIVCNNGVVKAKHQSGLPLGYTLLDYIEFSGTQYIDTGVKFSGSVTELDTTMAVTSLGTAMTLAATQNNSVSPASRWGSMQWVNSSNKFGTAVGSISLDRGLLFDASVNVQTYIKIITNDTNKSLTATYGDITQTMTYEGSLDTNLNLLIGAKNTNTGVSEYFKGKVYSMSLKIDDVLMFNFVPVRRLSDNVLGMYDLVNGQFFTNAGTGDFTAGNLVNDPAEIYTDGTTEKVEVFGKNLLNGADEGVIEGQYLKSDGTTGSNASFSISNYIKIPVGVTSLTLSTTDTSGSGLGSAAYSCFYNSSKIFISSQQQGGTQVRTLNIPNNAEYIRVSWNNTKGQVQVELGSTATTYEPYFNGGSATAEDLLAVSTYKDEQNVTTGDVTRKVGIKVFDGTETWAKSNNYSGAFYTDNLINPITNSQGFCTHAKWTSQANFSQNECYYGTSAFIFWNSNFTPSSTVNDFKAWLQQQYAAGTPVIIVYPLATPTTETVTGQTLTASGNCTVTATGSLNNLELELSYKQSI